MFEISHGHIVEGDDDDFIRMAKQVDDDISVLMVPGNFLVDFFSFCELLIYNLRDDTNVLVCNLGSAIYPRLDWSTF